MVEAVPGGGRVRIDGEIRHVPTAWKTLKIPFRHGKRWGMTIPWGTWPARFYSTGIPNIEVYTTAPRGQIAWLRRLRFLLPLLAWKPVQNAIKGRIGRTTKGPNEAERQSGARRCGDG